MSRPAVLPRRRRTVEDEECLQRCPTSDSTRPRQCLQDGVAVLLRNQNLTGSRLDTRITAPWLPTSRLNLRQRMPRARPRLNRGRLPLLLRPCNCIVGWTLVFLHYAVPFSAKTAKMAMRARISRREHRGCLSSNNTYLLDESAILHSGYIVDACMFRFRFSFL